MNEEKLYERWDLLQEFLKALDPDLEFMAISGIQVKPGVIEVTNDVPVLVGNEYQAIEQKRSYRFAKEGDAG